MNDMRLGDLDKAEAVLRNIADHLKESGRDDLWPATYAAADVIKQQRTIDAVPVVRCKDCIHWLNEDGMNDHVCLKIYSDGAVSSYAWQDRRPDDFCSYGERKDGEG